jgi:hypothetical protein
MIFSSLGSAVLSFNALDWAAVKPEAFFGSLFSLEDDILRKIIGGRDLWLIE